MAQPHDEDAQLRSVALEDANTVFATRQREDELRARLAAVVESSDDAIISKTLDGIITTWNKGAERIFGYKADEVVGKSITILIPEDRLNEESEIIKTVKSGLPIEHYETVRRRKDGSAVDISLTVSPVKDADGRLVGASKIARDITLRKQIEGSLRENAERLKLAMGAADLGAWDWEAKTDAITLSQRAAEIFGVRPETPVTRTQMRELIHEDHRESPARQSAGWRGASRIRHPVSSQPPRWQADLGCGQGTRFIRRGRNARSYARGFTGHHGAQKTRGGAGAAV